jgi:hypothetical protein
LRLAIADQLTASVLEGGFDDLLITRYECVSPCPTDFDNNGETNGADLASLLSAWAQPGVTDLDGNGVTDGGDIAVLLSAWGLCN